MSRTRIDPSLLNNLSSNLNLGSNKIVSLANGSAGTDAMAFGQNKVIQYVTSFSTTDFSTSSTSYQITNLTVSITPTSASNKILIFAMGTSRGPGNGQGCQASLFNGATDLLSGNGGPYAYVATGGLFIMPWSACWLDSPASTSSQTYSVKIRNQNTAGTVIFTGEQFIIVMEVS